MIHGLAGIHLVRGLTKSHFAKGGKDGLFKEILLGQLRLRRGVDDSAVEPVEQRARREVDENNFVGALQDPVWNGFAHLNARDLPHLIVEAFEVLNVHGRENVNARGEQRHHILPALGPRRAGYIRVGKLVHQADFRMAGENGVGIHLLKSSFAVCNAAAGNRFQALGPRNGVLPAVGFEIADHHIVPGRGQALALIEHPECFADPGGVAQDNFQPAFGADWFNRRHEVRVPVAAERCGYRGPSSRGSAVRRGSPESGPRSQCVGYGRRRSV